MCFRSSNISNAMDHEEVSDEDETSDCAHRPEVDLPSFVISNPTKVILILRFFKWLKKSNCCRI